MLGRVSAACANPPRAATNAAKIRNSFMGNLDSHESSFRSENMPSRNPQEFLPGAERPPASITTRRPPVNTQPWCRIRIHSPTGPVPVETGLGTKWSNASCATFPPRSVGIVASLGWRRCRRSGAGGGASIAIPFGYQTCLHRYGTGGDENRLVPKRTPHGRFSIWCQRPVCATIAATGASAHCHLL
jgi:hypothetical protein